jgi:hypothetical protein
MSEHRQKPRRRVIKGGSIRFNVSSGSIKFNGEAGIDCRVRDLSASGACLEVVSHLGIPEEFVLVMPRDGLSQPCRVIWRKGLRIGVQFGVS